MSITRCVWQKEPKSDRAWYAAVNHPHEDSEQLRTLSYWNFCPYCGLELETQSAKDS